MAHGPSRRNGESGDRKMRFLITRGGQLKERLRSFPSYYASVFSSAYMSIVVCVTNNSDVVAACGILSPLNYLLLYVKEQYRGRGLGTRVLEKTIYVARRRNLNFINLAVSSGNVPALRIYSKLGFRETVSFPKFKFRLMMLPFNIEGEIAYAFLHEVVSKMPKTFLLQVIVFMMSVTKRFRQMKATSTT